MGNKYDFPNRELVEEKRAVAQAQVFCILFLVH